MSSSDATPEGTSAATLNATQRQVLLDTARSAIEQGLAAAAHVDVDATVCAPDLQAPRATFVTLRGPGGDLRGCMGSAEATRPLVEDVARNAYNAAFLDPRFAPVTADELADLQLHISVLSPMAPLPADSAAQLLARVRPGIDGLLLVEGDRRATLLPAVWESLPDPGVFLDQLRRKAGLAGDHWSDTIRFFRYTAESFS